MNAFFVMSSRAASFVTRARISRTKSLPYSHPEFEILKKRFPQSPPRRAAVKISVDELRMKFFSWLPNNDSQQASRCYEYPCQTRDVFN
jgi:hypothetical protein